MLEVAIFALVENVLGLYCNFEEEFLKFDVVEARFRVTWAEDGGAKQKCK